MLNDQELDKLLANASAPEPRSGFEKRLKQKLGFDNGSNIVSFPQKQKTSLWIVALPVAASLVIGIWLGSTDRVESIFPVATSDDAIIEGVTNIDSDDLDILFEEQQS
jgi:hypothetical protein